MAPETLGSMLSPCPPHSLASARSVGKHWAQSVYSVGCLEWVGLQGWWLPGVSRGFFVHTLVLKRHLCFIEEEALETGLGKEESLPLLKV